MKNPEIKIKIELSEGYEQRFTKACLDILKKRDNKKEVENERRD